MAQLRCRYMTHGSPGFRRSSAWNSSCATSQQQNTCRHRSNDFLVEQGSSQQHEVAGIGGHQDSSEQAIKTTIPKSPAVETNLDDSVSDRTDRTCSHLPMSGSGTTQRPFRASRHCGALVLNSKRRRHDFAEVVARDREIAWRLRSRCLDSDCNRLLFSTTEGSTKDRLFTPQQLEASEEYAAQEGLESARSYEHFLWAEERTGHL